MDISIKVIMINKTPPIIAPRLLDPSPVPVVVTPPSRVLAVVIPHND